MYFSTADIDECKGINNCTNKQICVNKPGNYECLCIKGYHLESAVCVSNQSSLAIHLAVGEYLYYIYVYCTLGFLLTNGGFCHVYSISCWEGWKLEQVPYFIFIKTFFWDDFLDM